MESQNSQSGYIASSRRTYRSAATTTRSLGLIVTAEGLDKIIQNDIKIGEGDALVSSGLKSLEVGEKLSELGKDGSAPAEEQEATAKLEPEIMEDSSVQELLAELAEATGYSEAEVLEKILDSRGDLELLTQNFPVLAKRKLKIEATQLTEEEAALAGSKFQSILGRLKLKSLRGALAQNLEERFQKPAEVSAAGGGTWLPYQALYSAAQSSSAELSSRPESPLATVMKARGPASVPEFPNIGENLPSFTLELSQAETSRSEPSLFEKVRRKYSEIAPSMTRK